MLLNETQHQHKATSEQLNAQMAEIRTLKKRVTEMQGDLLGLRARDQLIAQR